MSNSLAERILKVFLEVFNEQNEGLVPPDIQPDSVLLETGLDSFGFAILVIRLEEVLEFDPFVLCAEAYYPRTFGEFVAFYEANQPK